jgi:hypothetical protein
MTLRNTQIQVNMLIKPRRGTNRIKTGLSREIRDGWQPLYTYIYIYNMYN